MESKACNMPVKFRVIIVVSTFLLILFFIVQLLESFLSKNISISEPTGYYLTIPIWGKIKRNHKYLVCINDSKYLVILQKLGLPDNHNSYSSSNDSCISGFPYLIKQVAAIPGDIVKVTVNGILINNKLQPNSQAFIAAKGIKLYPLPLDYQITLRQNEYFILGITAHSIDSRYFGIIKKDQFYKQALLIFKEN